MSYISFACPGCKKKVKLKSELAGKKVTCQCGQKIIVPDSPAESSSVHQVERLPIVTQPQTKTKAPATNPETGRTVDAVPAVVPARPLSDAAVVNRNLKPCQACGISVSRQALRCPQCGHILRRARRGLFGQIFKWVFILFNILMVFFMYRGCQAANEVIVRTQSEAQTAGAVVGAGIGVGVLIFVWVAGDIILGLFVLFTRPRE